MIRDTMPILPRSFDPKSNTVDVVWSTGARIRRAAGAREFIEELDLSGARLDRLNAGAPFLRVHRADSIASILGVVVAGSARIEGARGLATIKLSSAKADAGAVLKIATGIVRSVSVGYQVHRVERAGEAGGVPILRVLDWEPFEVSAVPIPADAGAHVRLYGMAGIAQDDQPHGAAALARARMARRARMALAASRSAA